MKTPSTLPTPLFQILSNTSPLPPTFIPTALFVILFFGWMGDRTTFDVLFYLMILWIYTCRALVPCTRSILTCVLWNKVSSLLWSDIYLSCYLFLWLNGWSHHIWCVILLNDIMDLHMSSLGTLYQKHLDVCFMEQGVKFTVVWHISSLLSLSLAEWVITPHMMCYFT